MQVIFVFFILCGLIDKVGGDSISSRLNNCGVNQGCWLVPPGCEQTTGPVCTGVVAWIVNAQSITFTLITYTTDLFARNPQNKAIYGAVGFSLDSFMGDDLVFVCAINETGKGQVYLAWNDHHEPERLYEATNSLVSEVQLSVVDNRMNCQFKWTFSGLQQVPPKYQPRMYNLSNPLAEFYLLFARGNVDPNTFELTPHSMVDGLLFPFITVETVNFCETGCGQSPGMPWITQMHQAPISQNLKQKIQLAHGFLMLISTFVLFPSAIMSARFNKDHLQRCCGVYLWFYAHWLCNMLGFLCVTGGFFAIYYTGYFKVFKCSVGCDDFSFARQMHAIFGTIAYSLMCAQVLAGMCRPKLTSPSRSGFNLIHTFNGYIIWILCCRSSLLATQMPKTGLPIYFDRFGEHVIWIGIYCCIACFLICEWLVHRERYVARNPDSIEELGAHNDNTKLIDDEDSFERASCAPVIVICFNAVAGLCISASILIMMLRAAKAKGFEL